MHPCRFLTCGEGYTHLRGYFTELLFWSLNAVCLFATEHTLTRRNWRTSQVNLELRPKLLRVLQEHQLERLGSNHIVQVGNARDCCTKQNLWAIAQEWEFRAVL